MAPRPIIYGPFAQLADRLAGRKDGKRGIPPLPAELDGDLDPSVGATQYLRTLHERLGSRSEKERHRLDHKLEPHRQQLAAIDQQIHDVEDRLERLQKRLDEMPERAPEEVLADRNPAEHYASDEVTRTRRQREYTAERNKVVAEERQASDGKRALCLQRAEIASAISGRNRTLARWVRHLHRFTLRRAATYRWSLQRHHPAGTDHRFARLLDPVEPTLPDWVAQLETERP